MATGDSAPILNLRGAGAPVTDARADEVVMLTAGALPEAVRRVLTALDPALGADAEVVATVVEQSAQPVGQSQR